ncbi:glycosyltransferase family 87 protein [Nakamurella endophytica]|uniref:Membrane protein n=1 Tax=Nakamurella endophytica TaxID=1748367 RepID=A0A917SV02_9ACTN|nr:glycosyltransferase 87 family protein [Nakamurella endophytica]GGL96750.1 membrane protein [Nakamurella endophytica]
MTDLPADPGSERPEARQGPVFAEHEVAGSARPPSPSGSRSEQRSGTVAVADPVAEPAPHGRRARRAAVGRADSLGPRDRVVPTWTDPTVRRASDLVGGPLGRHALVGRAPILTPLRVCLAMAIVVLICGWLYKAACIQQTSDGNGGVVLDQGGQRPWITGCYNDVVPLYGSHKLDTLSKPYATSWDEDGQARYMEYPVVTGYWMWGVAEVSHWYGQLAAQIGLPVPLNVAGYFTINAVLLALLYLLAVACTARMARRRIWDTAIMCLSPLLVVHAFTNWDLLAIGLTAAAMWAWSRGRWDPDRPNAAVGWAVACGVLVGVGTAAKLYPVLLLGPLLVLCVRTGRLRPWFAAAGSAAVVWLVINVPVALAYPSGWYEFIRLNSERPAEYDSWYFLFSTFSGSRVFDAAPGATSPTFLNWFSLLLFGIACVAIGWFALAARRRPRVAQLFFLVVAAFLLTNKVWSPQYSLWLLPLVVLALPRWRPVLAWQFAEWAVWILLMLTFDTDAGKNLPIYPFAGAAVIRDVLLLALVIRVVREIRRPDRDLVRLAGDDDPTGGVLDGAPDRRTVPGLVLAGPLGRVRALRGARGRSAAGDWDDPGDPDVPAAVGPTPARG